MAPGHEPKPFNIERCSNISIRKCEPSSPARRRGRGRLPIRINPGLSRGIVFIPSHWGDQQGENPRDDSRGDTDLTTGKPDPASRAFFKRD
jgi:hypothetical protein